MAVVVSGPGLEERVTETVGQVEEWKEQWGQSRDFRELALRKAMLAERTRMPTDLAVSRMPWLLEEGDYLYQGGTGEPGGLTVAASGAFGTTDEGISDLVRALIVMLCRLKVMQMKEAGTNRV